MVVCFKDYKKICKLKSKEWGVRVKRKDILDTDWKYTTVTLHTNESPLVYLSGLIFQVYMMPFLLPPKKEELTSVLQLKKRYNLEHFFKHKGNIYYNQKSG